MEFTEKNVLLNVNANDKDELLEKIANYAQKIGFTDDPKGLLKSFKEREKEYSTGLQDGFAIPHAKSEAVKEVGIIYARLHEPIEWKTYDNKPVTDVLALMVPPKNAGNTYLKMLSSLSTALIEDEFKKTLKSLTDKQKISDLINEKMGAEIL